MRLGKIGEPRHVLDSRADRGRQLRIGRIGLKGLRANPVVDDLDIKRALGFAAGTAQRERQPVCRPAHQLEPFGAHVIQHLVIGVLRRTETIADLAVGQIVMEIFRMRIVDLAETPLEAWLGRRASKTIVRVIG